MYAYLQLKSLLSSMDDKESLVLNKTPFWKFSAFVNHSLSSIYAFLQTPSSPSLFGSGRMSRALIFLSKKCKKTFILTHKLPMACFVQEKNYKILTRWYRYPTLLHRIYPSMPSQERCFTSGGLPSPIAFLGSPTLFPLQWAFFFCFRG